MSGRLSGKVKWFDDQKGFGFITPDDGSPDIFVHQSYIQVHGFRSLAEGESVEYQVEYERDGRSKAVQVTGPHGASVQGTKRGGGGGGGYGGGGGGGAVRSRNHDYSHFISLPLAIHPDLVSKLINFQNTILGNDDSNETEDTTHNKEGDQLSKEIAHLALDDAPKPSKVSTSSDLGIEKSIFIDPKTFHLTVLMLKLWNEDRVQTATELLQSISSKVMKALDDRPVSIGLKGLECMKGSVDEAHVLYAPVEEIGSEGRLLHACQVIIDAYIEAGLVLENDVNHTLKMHATVMNSRHRERTKWKTDKESFNAQGIFEKYGSEDWGQYLIREAHLSKRFSSDETGYYHCCASIPFPENKPGRVSD